MKSKAIAIQFRRWIRAVSPSKAIHKYLGISHLVYRGYLQSQFTSSMSWDNYGKEWQIDHIVPMCLFDLNDPKEIALCWCLDNIRPIRTQENRLKGAAIEASYFILLNKQPINEQDFAQLTNRINGYLYKTYSYISTQSTGKL